MKLKEKILKVMKEFGRLPTSRIGGILGINYNYTKNVLEELEKENKVIKEKETSAVYWKLKK